MFNANQKNQLGQIFAPIKIYIAGQNEIRAFDAVTSLDLGTRIPVQGVNIIQTYFKQ